VPGYPGFHIAKTKLRVTATEIIFSYRLLFRVDIHSRTVIKLRIEIASPEDMGIGDTLNDPEDDIPF